MRLRFLYITLIAFSFLIGCQSANGQDKKKSDKEVPEAVRTTFQAKYPGEDDPDWHTDDHGYWESRFRIDGIRHRADFLPDGTWVETEVSIEKKQLPDAVIKIIDDKFNDEEITEIEKVDSAKKGAFYDVEFKRKGKNKDVEFRASGEIIN